MLFSRLRDVFLLAGFVAAGYPPRPKDLVTIKSKSLPGATITYKEVPVSAYADFDAPHHHLTTHASLVLTHHRKESVAMPSHTPAISTSLPTLCARLLKIFRLISTFGILSLK